MVQVSEQQTNPGQSMLAVVHDPTVVKAAQQIYQTYCRLHRQITKSPTGVAIDPSTRRGQLIFKDQPILLPGECFVALKQLEISK